MTSDTDMNFGNGYDIGYGHDTWIRIWEAPRLGLDRTGRTARFALIWRSGDMLDVDDRLESAR
jgi:hypothetical protein